MNQWKLTLSYHGAGFHGWQIQPGLVTVQGLLAEALKRITGEEVLPQGAGRTDTGVHALAQVASFALGSPVPAPGLQRALNRALPASVRILAAEVVPSSFHARHSARGKVYEYRIFERHAPVAGDSPAPPDPSPERICSPFLAPFVWDCRWPLNPDAMQRAAALLVGTQDFSAMAAASRPDRDGSAPNPIKTIHQASWSRQDDLLIFRIAGSGFLHHMVRNLVGTLVDIGRGSLPVAALPRILASRERAQAGPTAPASGLYLFEVVYPADAPATQAEVADTDEASLTLATAGAGA